MNNNPKILIIDDDIFLLDMYALKFKESGFDVEISKSGAEALEKLESNNFSPAAILLDILMPMMDGFELLKNLKEKRLAENSKIIVLSNLGQKEEIERGISLGADDYIVKAYHTPSEVVEKVRKIMNEPRANASIARDKLRE